jgi:hypothetical protein
VAACEIWTFVSFGRGLVMADVEVVAGQRGVMIARPGTGFHRHFGKDIDPVTILAAFESLGDMFLGFGVEMALNAKGLNEQVDLRLASAKAVLECLVRMRARGLWGRELGEGFRDGDLDVGCGWLVMDEDRDDSVVEGGLFKMDYKDVSRGWCEGGWRVKHTEIGVLVKLIFLKSV